MNKLSLDLVLRYIPTDLGGERRRTALKRAVMDSADQNNNYFIKFIWKSGNVRRGQKN